MYLPKKFIMSDIAREELTARELELLVVLEKLTGMANCLQEELLQQKQEIAALKKAKKNR
jgi:hypothetical protein